MSLEDPFYFVKDEVFKALNKIRGLYLRWQEISKSPANSNSTEVEWTLRELRNALRSIEWDLEDLEDTINISIVERNSSKFCIDNNEIYDRKNFINMTQREVKMMKSKLNLSRKHDEDGTAYEPLLADFEGSVSFTTSTFTSTPNGYNKNLLLQADSTKEFDEDNLEDTMHTNQYRMTPQINQFQEISNCIGNLQTVSKQIGIELEDQSTTLIEMGKKPENADSKIRARLNRISRILHISDEQKKWLIGSACFIIMVVCLMLFFFL